MTDFIVYPAPRAGLYVVDIQSPLLNSIATRVVIPLVPKAAAPPVLISTLNPLFSIGGREFVLMTQNLASLPVQQLRDPVGTLSPQRDSIVRSIDALLGGI